MQTGWLDDGGRRYFLEEWAMAKGWTSQNGKWYYAGQLQELFPGLDQ